MSRTTTAPPASRNASSIRKLWRPDQPLRVVLIGTDFEVRVWETLLKIPMGRAVCYSDIANKIKNPKASRAVGAAVGRNPVSFVVPCHRALGKGGALTGYHWGITRKQAMLGWEAGQVGAALTASSGGLPHGTESPVRGRRFPGGASKDLTRCLWTVNSNRPTALPPTGKD